jgi:protein arginine N-methyltransferase 2
MEVDEDVEALSILGEHLINTILADEPIEAIKSIIDNGAPLWFQNEEEGISPLHAAAYRQNPDLVRFLIEQGAIWNASELETAECHPS